MRHAVSFKFSLVKQIFMTDFLRTGVAGTRTWFAVRPADRGTELRIRGARPSGKFDQNSVSGFCDYARWRLAVSFPRLESSISHEGISSSALPLAPRVWEGFPVILFSHYALMAPMAAKRAARKGAKKAVKKAIRKSTKPKAKKVTALLQGFEWHSCAGRYQQTASVVEVASGLAAWLANSHSHARVGRESQRSSPLRWRAMARRRAWRRARVPRRTLLR